MGGFDDGADHVPAGGDQRIDDLLGTGRRKAPVGGERQHQEIRAGLLEGGHQIAAPLAGGIEEVQRPGHEQIGVRVKALGEALALVAQVAFHLKLHVARGAEVPGLQFAAKLLPHAEVRQVGDVADHARQAKAHVRVGVGRAIVPVSVLRVRGDGLAGDFVEGDVLRRELGGGGYQHRGANALRQVDGPLHGLHAAEAAAHHGGEPLDAQVVGQQGLAAHPVLDRHGGKGGPEHLAGRRIHRCGAGAAVAAAEIVGRDDEEAVGVHRLAGADAGVPPAGLGVVLGMVASGMVVAGQRMANQHRVAAGGVELAVGLEHQLEAVQGLAALQRELAGGAKALRGDDAHAAFVCGVLGHAWDGSGKRVRRPRRRVAAGCAAGCRAAGSPRSAKSPCPPSAE